MNRLFCGGGLHLCGSQAPLTYIFDLVESGRFRRHIYGSVQWFEECMRGLCVNPSASEGG